MIIILSILRLCELLAFVQVIFLLGLHMVSSLKKLSTEEWDHKINY